MSDLVKHLRILLASNFTLYLKAQMFHWNVEGKDFPQYHDFLSKVYEDLYEQNDKLAETIRTLEEYAPGSLSVYSEISRIEDEEKYGTAEYMMSKLLSDNDVMISLYKTLYNLAEEAEEFQISDYAAGRLDSHKKLAWMLRSIVK